MKGKQSGIATAAIAVVVIVVIAVIGVGAYLLLRKPTEPGGFSLPGGFTRTYQTEVMGYTATTYTGSGTVADATSSFRTALEDAGWTCKGEAMLAGYTGVYFEKGDEAALIYAMEAEGQVTVTVVIGPKVAPEGEGLAPGPEEEGLPSSDQATGTEPITRYPGSVMLSHTADQAGIWITYGTTDSVSTVVNWYKTEALAGWTSVMESTAEGTTTLMYSRDTEDVIIGVGPDGYTTIEVLYYSE